MKPEDMHRVESRLRQHWDLVSQNWQSYASVIRLACDRLFAIAYRLTKISRSHYFFCDELKIVNR